MADRGLLRATRVAVFSLVCVLLAATGHSVAGGHHPPFALLAVGGTAVAVTAGRLAGRERTFGQIAGAVTVTQGALHLFFAFTGPDHSRTSPSAANGQPVELMSHAGHMGAYGSEVVTGAAGAGAESVGMATASAHLSPLMLLAHLVAGLGAAWWLRQGEAVVWRLCRLLGAPLSAALHALSLLRRWSRVGALLARRRHPLDRGSDREVPYRTRVLEHMVARRGPPVLFTH
ncbi:hypothetical protein [Streptomyces marianii]|uniref:Integral membrane protein n=1 Tax=Streptomyces marianii TaxID=1817406 RepID=A0A5R9EC49_9ACTN|nr:hypothetical protein [Streptomyces marianii]TLQ47771.1 hypothetical protein FEF34_36940 [Streptomyces marianii]